MMDAKTVILEAEKKDGIVRQVSIRCQAVTQFATQVLNSTVKDGNELESAKQSTIAACEMLEESVNELKEVLTR
jgi:hypothetical protein